MKLNERNKTYLPKKDDIEKKWWIVDAQDQVLGRMATRIANVLRGKNKPGYTPFMDTGDFVIVINAEKVKVTGKKDEQKKYYHHTGYPGGIREVGYKRMQERNPDRIIKAAVKGMLPNNKLGRKMINKLKVYRGTDYKQEAQKPEKLEI